MKSIALSILVALIAQFTFEIGILTSFKINQDYIAEVLCIEREVENNSCQGTCHLKNQLLNESDQSNSEGQEAIEIQEIPFFVFSSSSNIAKAKLPFEGYIQKDVIVPGISALDKIFHPPRV